MRPHTSIEDPDRSQPDAPDARGMHSVDHMNLVRLAPLMNLSTGSPETVIGLMDGPIAMYHPNLEAESLRETLGELRAGCAHAGSAACTHRTFTAGMLSAKRGSFPSPGELSGMRAAGAPYLQRRRHVSLVATGDSAGTAVPIRRRREFS